MKIIIVGAGKVGGTLAEQLAREDHDITVIDVKPGVIKNTGDALDILTIEGNGASYEIQEEAGVAESDLLIAVTGSDERNLLCCLIAKKVGAKNTIARVRNPEYDSELHLIKDELGLSMSVNPERAAAAEIARLLQFPSAIKIDPFSGGRMELLKLSVGDGCTLAGVQIKDVFKRVKNHVLICVVERGGNVFIPGGSFTLERGDLISIIAPPTKAKAFFREVDVVSDEVRSVMLMGGGRIAYYLAKKLLPLGLDVKIIEIERERAEELSLALPDAMVICGDTGDQQMLHEEGISEMDAICTLTGFDEENVLLSLYAKSQNPRAKVITKINRTTFEDIIDDLDIGSVVYPKYITAESILRYVRAMQNSVGSNVETLYKIVGDRAEALEFRVNSSSELIGIPLNELPLRDNLLIAGINRNGKIIIPHGQDCIEAGDTVVIVTTHAGLRDLSDIKA